MLLYRQKFPTATIALNNSGVLWSAGGGGGGGGGALGGRGKEGDV